MKEVQRALEGNDLGRALELLERYRPLNKSEIRNSRSEVDLRGWEWRYLWSRCQSDESSTLCRYSNAVAAVSFSADGKWLAVRHEGGAVVLWDPVTKKEQLELPSRALGPWAKNLAFSPQGNLFAWSNQDTNGTNVVYLEEPGRRHETASLVHPGPVRSLTFSPDGKLLATMADDGAVRIWDVKSHRLTTSLAVPPFDFTVGRGTVWRGLSPHFASYTGWSDRYGSVLFSPDTRCLAVAELNHVKPQIRLFDLTTGKERKPIPISAPGDGVSALAFSPDSRFLAAGCGVEDTEVHIWELKTGSEVRLEGHSRWVAALAFSPDGKTLASGSADQTIRLWDLADHIEKRRFQGHTDEIWAFAWLPDGKELISSGKDGSVRCWDPGQNRTNISHLAANVIQSWGLAFLPDGQGLLTLGKSDGAVEHRDPRQLRVVKRLPFLGSGHTAMDLSPNSRWLALGDKTGEVEIWDLPARQNVTNLVVPGCSINIVFFSPQGNLLCVADAGVGDPKGKIWAVPNWQEIELEGILLKGGWEANFSPDERLLGMGYRGGNAALWDLKTRQLIARFESGHSAAAWVAFSPDRRFFATGGLHDGRLVLWDMATHMARPFGRVARNGMQELAFSPDSQRLVFGEMGPPGAVKLWDVATGREVATLPGKFGFTNHILFSPDGNTLLAATIEGEVLLWQAPSFAEIEQREAARTAGR
ncbi:MAG: WD40 repeat domain-containing protein [Verrucomicrobiia bacterium]